MGLILLIEDDLEHAARVVATLHSIRADVTVVVMEDAETALHYLRGKPPYQDRRQHPLPRLVLLDITLPAMDALELLGWMRSQPVAELRRVPVVICLDGSRDRVGEAYDRGASSVIHKLPNGDELRRQLEVLDLFWRSCD